MANWFNKILSPLLGQKQSGFDAWSIFMTGGQTAAGESVTIETAMNNPVVFACVRVRAESVAQLPLITYRKSGEQRERARDHWLYDLVHDQPNAWTSATEFKLSMETALSLHGNAFAFLNIASGQVREIIQVPSNSVTVEVDEQSLEPRYRVANNDGTETIYDRRQILHLKGIGTQPHKGDSPVHRCREAIGMANAMEKHSAALFSNGARPSGLIKVPMPLDAETNAKLRDEWAAVYGGTANAHKVAVLGADADFKPISMTALDAQLLELRRHQIAEICRVWRVPLHLVQEIERATHLNAETLGQQFLTFGLLPELKIWEGAIKRTLLADESDDVFAEFLVDDLVRADIVARFESYGTAINSGILSANEVRRFENLAPYAGGDAYRLPLNTGVVGDDDAA